MAADLLERLVALAGEARDAAASPENAAALSEVVDRLEAPLRLAISGKVKAGKSTLLNALVGENLAATDAGECTKLVTWYRYSERPYAAVFPVDGERTETAYRREPDALAIDLGGRAVDEVDHLEVGWPSARLKSLVLIDTPGIASISVDVSARTHEAMSAEAGRVPVADAVLYLLRHTHSDDLRFLEAFHEDKLAEGTPVNTVGVLSRADEIGSARLDAMEVARRVADRYQDDGRLHRLCPIVVPVNGLLGHAATTLREDEYGDLAALATAPGEQAQDLLLTAERLATRESPLVPVGRRVRLLDRLGLFGVRLGVESLRTGAATSSPELCRLFAESSGLEGLREVILRQFDERSRVLRARSAVTALRELFADGTVDQGRFLPRLEEITSSAHEFQEVRVLTELRSGELPLTPDQEAELDLLMGGAGHDPRTRLGLAPEAEQEAVRQAALAVLSRWQRVERHPLSARATQVAARTATRSIEGIIASI